MAVMKPTSSMYCSSGCLRRSRERLGMVAGSTFMLRLDPLLESDRNSTLRLEVEPQERQHLLGDAARHRAVLVALECVGTRGVVDESQRKVQRQRAGRELIQGGVDAGKLLQARADDEERHVGGQLLDGTA